MALVGNFHLKQLYVGIYHYNGNGIPELSETPL